MIASRERLTRDDFTAVSRDSSTKRLASRNFSLVFTKDAQKTGSAIVISKKVEKSSVKRHLLKRRITEVMRKKKMPGSSIIVYAREGSSALPFVELSKELSALLDRLSSNTYPS